MADSDRHPELLTLDAVRAGEAVDPADSEHIAVCLACQAQLGELRALAGDVKALAAVPGVVSEATDVRITWLARGHAARVRRTQRRGWRRLVAAPAIWAAAAVAVVALASVLLLSRRGEAPLERLVAGAPAPRVGQLQTAADLDGDKRVTVLDALALARAVEHQGAARTVDVNGDQRTDEQDVDAVMAMAVSVRGT